MNYVFFCTLQCRVLGNFGFFAMIGLIFGVFSTSLFNIQDLLGSVRLADRKQASVFNVISCITKALMAVSAVLSLVK